MNAIPSEWRSAVKVKPYHEPSPLDKNCYQILISNKTVNLSDTKSRVLYKQFRSHKQTSPTAQAKLKNRYPDLSVDWKNIYSLAFEVTLDTKLREFQYKLLNLIIFTNEKLYKFKIIESLLCTFCNEEVESLEHLSYLCKISSFFWKELLSWLAVQRNKDLDISFMEILFGKFDISDDSLLVNHVLLLAKFFLYKCKLSNINPSLKVFKAKLKATYTLETYIARKNGILLKHYKKWDCLLSILT